MEELEKRHSTIFSCRCHVNKNYTEILVEISSISSLVKGPKYLNPLNYVYQLREQMEICWIHLLDPRYQLFLLPDILVELTGFPYPIYAFFQTNFL